MVSTDLMARPPGPATQRAGRLWLMLVVLLLGQFMGLLDVTIVNVAVPTIGTDLHASGASLQLVVGGYTVAYAMLLITGARLGDLYGRRRMYLLGAVVFTLTSLICGLAPNSATLIVARFVQGSRRGGDGATDHQRHPDPLRRYGTRQGAVGLWGRVVDRRSGGPGPGRHPGRRRPTERRLAIGLPGQRAPGSAPGGARPGVRSGRRAPGRSRLDFAGLAIAVPAVFLVVLPLVLGHQAGWPLWTFLCIAHAASCWPGSSSWSSGASRPAAVTRC